MRTVIFDEELSPAQGRNIQNAIAKVCGEGNVKVLDRTMLILQIFAQRARTKEAKLQVSVCVCLCVCVCECVYNIYLQKMCNILIHYHM